MKKLLWTLLVFSPVCVIGQSPDSAAVRGRVTGPNGQVVSGTRVAIEDTQHHVVRSVVPGPDGDFAVEGLAPETVMVRADAQGLEASSGELTLAAGTRAMVELHLHVPSVHVAVEVTGVVGEVRTDEPQLGDRLTAEQAQAMPLPNRRITFLPLVNAANHPAINQGDVFMNQMLFTANGTGRRQTWFEVNGANGNDMWGRQTIFTNVPLSAIGEMTVLENAFAADYGFGEGAVVNVVTRSGGSRFHGNVLGLWRPSGPEAALSGFTAKNAASGNDITRDTLAQGAATVSGPVTKEGQTYYTASAEYSYQDRASPVISPLAPGNYIGHYRDWMGLLRLDHTIREGQRVFAFLSADGFFDTNPNGTVGGNNLPSVARVFHRKTYTGELGDTAVLNPTMVNEARVE
ncbi:MAG TPA: TonB-dependent receptor, partial [Acidobacteriaceae bacterium]|nr:TonB-dependent receptor [Acidobacteriaceae bacterium]